MVSIPARQTGALRELLTGAGYLMRGLGHFRHAPGVMLLGWIPALIVFAVFVTAIVLLGVNLENVVAAITPFADGWSEGAQAVLRLAVGIAVILAAGFLGIFLFTTVTLIVGAWFYERIWMSVERRFGAVPDAGLGFWKGAAVGVTDALRMLVPTVLLGVAVFAVSLVPLVGAALSFVLGALAGGWLLTIDLTGFALTARRLTLRQRRAAVRARRARTTGFGVATYLLFLVPGGTILAMPAAVAGASLLARDLSAPAPPPPAA